MLGKKAPDFKLQAWNINKFETVSLSSYKGKYVIIIFYPFDFTFVCPTEIIGFSKRKEEFDKLNAQILFVSCDSVYAHKAWAQVEESQGGIKGTIYPILSDVERLMSAHYKMLGDSGVCYRGTVILNKDSIVKSVFYYDDKVGRSVDEVIRVVQNIKQLDENNNIPFCPLDYTVSKK